MGTDTKGGGSGLISGVIQVFAGMERRNKEIYHSYE
jgi:hypothetical protein